MIVWICVPGKKLCKVGFYDLIQLFFFFQREISLKRKYVLQDSDLGILKKKMLL